MDFRKSSIENLRRLGYTRDEARFLYLVAMHSGYFSARQYLTFTGAKSGEKSMAFTQKLLGKGHAATRLLLRNGRVYHLYSRLVYRAIGREHLRNRREHSVEHMRTKLAILDFVLGHLDYRYLETEDDKVAYFCRDLGIARFVLPAKHYAGVTSPSFCTTANERVYITTSSGKGANGGSQEAVGDRRAAICGAKVTGAGGL
jgi:hypothetical protein